MFDKSTFGNGAGLILTIVFVILKLTGQIAWSWWWVFSPIWIGICVLAILCMVIGFITLYVDKNY